MFFPKSGRGSVGNIKEDGTYTMGTYQNDDGASVGVHRVIVKVKKYLTTSDEDTGAPSANPNAVLIPSHYENPKTSGLEVEVKSGEENVYDIKLESKSKGVAKN